MAAKDTDRRFRVCRPAHASWRESSPGPARGPAGTGPALDRCLTSWARPERGDDSDEIGRRTFRPLSYARRMARPGHPRRCEAPFRRSAGRPGRISDSVRRAVTASLGEARPPVCCYTAPTG